MENQKLNDLKIAGSMTVPGGTFNKVSISGEGNLTSPVECNDFSVSGSASVMGDVIAKSIKISGKATIKGNIDAESIKVSGDSELKGDVKVKELNIHGSTSIFGNVISDIVNVHGGINIGGDCTSEKFTSRGGFNIKGLINSGNIDIKVHFPCHVKEIGGENIKVHKGNYKLKEFIRTYILPSLESNSLHCDIIECDDIYLECTKAKIVRGNNVVIGPNCEIEMVEYKNYYEKSKDSVVKEQKNI
jgi:cytoskeletal protein CcmA (bactofilin family)